MISNQKFAHEIVNLIVPEMKGENGQAPIYLPQFRQP